LANISGVLPIPTKAKEGMVQAHYWDKVAARPCPTNAWWEPMRAMRLCFGQSELAETIFVAAQAGVTIALRKGARTLFSSTQRAKKAFQKAQIEDNGRLKSKRGGDRD
jgi:hypothetical protein